MKNETIQFTDDGVVWRVDGAAVQHFDTIEDLREHTRRRIEFQREQGQRHQRISDSHMRRAYEIGVFLNEIGG